MAFLLKLCSVQNNSKVVRYARKQGSLDHFANSQTDFPLGAILNDSAIERGEGSKIGRNCQQIVLKSCLGCVVKTGHIRLLVLLKTVKVCIVSETNAEFQLSQICLKMAFFES